MAVTSIWPIKGRVDSVIKYIGNPEKVSDANLNELAALHAVKGVIEYAANDMKTEKRMFVTGINCTEQNAIHRFNETISRYGRDHDRVCYHGIQSFAEGEVDAETAHKIGVELARRLWGDRFHVVVATHCNTNHYHNHFCLCAVSHVDGKKYLNKKEDYRQMREESDRLCREYGLSTIRHPDGQRKNYAEWQAEKEGKPTIRGSIREAIDVAIRGSVNPQQFLRAMDQMGYIIDQSGKYPKIKQVGSQRFVRFKSLGEGYDVEDIMKRIYTRHHPVFPNIPDQENPRQIFDDEDESVQYMDYISMYRCYVKALAITQERPETNRNMNFLVRDDQGYARRYSNQVELLAEHNIRNAADVLAYRKEADKKIAEMTDKRREMRNALKRAQRAGNETAIIQARHNIQVYTTQLYKLRRETQACDDIMLRAETVREKLLRIEQGKFHGKEEIIQNEYIRRSGGSDRQTQSGRGGDGDTTVR